MHTLQFLDAQRIHNLVTYLQELHALCLANADHTTLLLNTYTKLKDVARLDSFIKTPYKRGHHSDDADTGEEALPFDIETAIRVTRQAGYFSHAAYLAKRWGRHEDYLRIMIDDLGAAEGDVISGVGEVKDKDKVQAGDGKESYREVIRYLRELVVGGGVSITTSFLLSICPTLLTIPLSGRKQPRTIWPRYA